MNPSQYKQKPKAPEKMPKAKAMALATRMKKGLVVASVIGFGMISGLAGFHQVGSTTTSSTSSSTPSSSSTKSSSSSQNSSNYLKQNSSSSNFGSSSSSSSSNSSSSSSSSSSSPVSGTSTS
ncbi:MAG TPA: hypothetical protein VKT25_10190 [Ktedonobacteraceae bacterium]|nr:hypothetical protein [Ktedonobacteraceae bacterium]